MSYYGSTDHSHYGYADASHSHRGEYADENHDHYLDYAEKYHGHDYADRDHDHQDLLEQIHELGGRLDAAAARIRDLEGQTPQARQLQLELWVGRVDVAKSRQAPWPLARGGQADIFAPIPYGTDVRGRVVKAPLIYGNWLLGAHPRQGKTAAVRVLACGCGAGPAGRDVGARAQGLRRPGPAGAGLPPVRLRRR